MFVLFAAALPWRELRDVARALALRYPAMDPAPMSSLGGQISPPGARHKSGGWRVLSVPLEDARAAVSYLNGPEVWAALLAGLAAELRQVEPTVPAGDVPDGAELDDSGAAWVPRLGGRVPLGVELEQIARTGRWDRSRYPGRSEAWMAILSAAVTRGWRLADVQAAIGSRAWSGLAALYERASEPDRLARLLPVEWRKAIGFTTGEKNVRSWPTSGVRPRPPGDDLTPAAEYGWIRHWVTAVDCAAEDPVRVRGWGGRAIAVRLVLERANALATVAALRPAWPGRRRRADGPPPAPTADADQSAASDWLKATRARFCPIPATPLDLRETSQMAAGGGYLTDRPTSTTA